MELETAERRWSGRVIVAAPGPSLTSAVADLCCCERVVVVNDAYRQIPWADVLYGCDAAWWDVHKGVPGFGGERWTSHSRRPLNDKSGLHERFKSIHMIEGRDDEGFSFDPRFIHYGRNSGFQAVNLAILMGGNPIVLVGFDMRRVDNRDHFFGSHPTGLTAPGPFADWINNFRRAAELLPPGIRILNATPGSAIDSFPMVNLGEILREKAA